MKAAILGTEDYHATMRQIADSSLRRIMSYVPPRMNLDGSSSSLPPVHVAYLGRVDAIMQDLVGTHQLTNCNPRSPFLIIAWLLVGSQNEYRICQYVDNVFIPKQVASIHIRIAPGDVPAYREILYAIMAVHSVVSNRTAKDATSVAWSAARAAKSISDDRTFKAGMAAADAARMTADAARISGIVEGVARTAIFSTALR